jgi:hypothetical protein
LIRLTPYTFLPHAPLPLLKTILTGLIVLFSNTSRKYIDNIHSSSFSLSPLRLPLVSTFPYRSYFTFLSSIVQRDFTMVFHTCIYCTLIRLTSFIALFLYPSCLLLFNKFQCISFMSSSYTDAMYINIIHYLSFSCPLPPPPVPSNSPTIIIMFYI